jgi:outer membrane protein TolC
MMWKMKKVLFILILSISTSAISAQEVSLSLNDCVVLSESNNPYIKNTYIDIQSANFQKKEVFAEYFPRLSFRALGVSSYDYFIDIVLGKDLGEFLRASEFGGYTKYGVNATMSLMQPLYAGGRIVTGNKLAKVGIKAAELKHQVNLREKKEEIEKSYWEIVALEQKRNTLEHLDELLKILQKDVNSAIDAGVITESDRMLVKMKMNELKSGRIQLEGGIKLLKMNLFNAIGQKYSLISEVADTLKPHIDKIVLSDRLTTLLPPSEYYIPEDEFAAGVTETELLDIMVEAKKLEKKLALGEYLPSAGIGISYGYSSFTNSNFNSIGIATISIPISNWGKGSMKLKRLDNEIQKAVNEKEYLTSQLILQARHLWLNLNVAWEQMKVAEENLEYAEKTVYDQMSRFNAGLVPISDVLMNQTKLFEATENLITKQIEYSKALTAYNGRKSK